MWRKNRVFCRFLYCYFIENTATLHFPKEIIYMRIFSFISYCLIIFSHSAFAQKDTVVGLQKKIIADKIWNLDVLAGVDLPMADMAKRFGTSTRLGVAIKIKTKRNYVFGVKAEFLNGKKIREDSLLNNITTSQGSVIALTGDLMNVGKFERGYIIGFQVGKIFPLFQLNNNSGPMLLSSVGFIQHKIKLFDKDNAFPQLNGDYRKGYDRLTNGVCLEQFVGYAYYAKNKLVNFYAGINFTWGFTQGRRSYLYDVARTDNASRNDILTGLKLGWVLPIYKKNVEETYY
jgi:hypothetical protein